MDERVELINQEISQIASNIVVEKFEGLLVDFARQKNAKIIVRGLRAVSDFEYEFQMFGMNSKLDSNIQTIFLPASENHHFIASKLVKEIAKLNGDISKFVTPNVAKNLFSKLNYGNR